MCSGLPAQFSLVRCFYMMLSHFRTSQQPSWSPFWWAVIADWEGVSVGGMSGMGDGRYRCWPM